MSQKNLKSYIIEIIVVFIGILLAFSLDNYRITLEEDGEREKYLQELSKEINENIASLDSTISYHEKDLDTVNKGRLALLKKDYADSILIKTVFIMFSKPYFNQKDQAYYTLINSNGLRLFEDIEFKSKLSELYRLYNDKAELDRIFNDYSGKYIVEYNYKNYNMLTYKPVDNSYFSRLDFGNNLMTYLVLSRQLLDHFKLLKEKNIYLKSLIENYNR